jgi:general secretion pathway protein G
MTTQQDVRRRGFTLIEIMAVVLIIGLLTALVGTAIVSNITKARQQTTFAQIKQLESALTFYQMDNGRFPTTEQGLRSLVEKPSGTPEPRNYRTGGYLQGGAVPLDAWGGSYQYASPGQHNPQGVDIWSYGADGQPGGGDADKDIGNWNDDQQG